MSPFRKFRMLLLRWHRRVGLVLLAFIVMLVVSGIAINHSVGWGLDKAAVQQNWLLNHYGIPTPIVRSFQSQNDWLAQSGRALYLNQKQIGECDGVLLGADTLGDSWLVLCEGRLQLFTRQGARLDDISQSLGLPAQVEAIAVDDKSVYLRTATGAIKFAPDLLTFVSVNDYTEDTPWVVPATAPAALGDYWSDAHRGGGISWERVLLDLHSGRLFGDVGVIVTDIAALFLLLLALSGAWVWLTKPGRWR